MRRSNNSSDIGHPSPTSTVSAFLLPHIAKYDLTQVNKGWHSEPSTEDTALSSPVLSGDEVGQMTTLNKPRKPMTYNFL